MAESEVKQKLAAILAADVAGYSRLMGQDERATVATLNEFRGVFREHIEANGGRVVDMAGDSVLAVFESAIGAATAAIDVQGELAKRNEALSEERRMAFRIGVNLGDIIEQDDGTIYGDGVNVAARLEAMANPGGINVSGSVFDSVRSKLETPFDYLGEHAVKNIADPVRAYSLGGGTATARRAIPRRTALAVGAVAAALLVAVGAWQLWENESEVSNSISTQPLLVERDFPTIAVIPFENLSGDPEQDYFAIGLTESLIERLGLFTEYGVISRNSTTQYAGTGIDPRQISEELGARYIVYGSVTKLDSAVRMSVQVVQGDTGEQIWAETYEGDLTTAGIFEIQDQFMETAAARILDYKGAVGLAETIGANSATPTENLEAYDCVMKTNIFWDRPTSEAHLALRTCHERAVKDDPNYAEAWASLSDLYRAEHDFGLNPMPGSLDRALDAAQHAVDADPSYWFSQYMLARVHFSRHEIDEFFARAQRVIALNPGNPTGLANIGASMIFAGEVDEGLTLMLKAVALNPNYPSWYNYGLASGFYMRGEYEEALAAALRCESGWDWDYVHRAVNYAQLGHRLEAKKEIDKLLELNPNYAESVWETFRIWNTPDEEIRKFLDGLRKAGLDVPDEPPLTN
jgi:adenylate cyclase